MVIASSQTNQNYLLALRQHRIFAGVANPADPSMMMQNAQSIAARLHTPPAVFDYLYTLSSRPLASRAEWNLEARLATALLWLLRAFQPGGSRLNGLIDPVAALLFRSETAALGRGALVLMSHDGFGVIARQAFERLFFGERFVFARKWMATPGSELFTALRRLREGCHVWISPEGQGGKQTGAITTAGLRLPIADGAAFLAFETGCPVVHFGVERTPLGFAPMLHYGPRRVSGESLGNFRERLHSFYAEQIGGILTGHPKNLALWPRRVKAILEHLSRTTH